MAKQGALAVDLYGLRQLVERRGKSFAIAELIQNAWDEDGVTDVSISLEHQYAGRCKLVIVDNAPEGFADLTHAFTLFAPSKKKADVTKRGRFNLGEKLVIALSTQFRVETTTGGVEINVDNNERRTLRTKREKGSMIGAILRMTQDEMDEAIESFFKLIPPDGITTTLNGTQLTPRMPLAIVEATLQTEIADDSGYLRPTKRQTTIEIYKPREGEKGTLYEMGIPVVETDDTYHVNVMQKVPLNADRDNVPPAFLRDVRAIVLNEMADKLTEDQSAASWVTEALEDDLVEAHAIKQVLDKRFGEKRVVYDPNDQEANRAATAAGFTVIPGRALPAAAWEGVRQFGLARPAGHVMPSPKPFHESGRPLSTIAIADYTEQQHTFATQVAALHIETTGSAISVVLSDDRGWQFAGCYGGGQIIINVARLTPDLNDARTLAVVLHEFAHKYGDHLTHEFDSAIARIAAKMILARQTF